MAFLKHAILAGLWVACLVAAVVMIWITYSDPEPTARDVLSQNVLLFILAVVPATIAGYYFTKMSGSDKVDAIAERSTEKMVLLSMQLHALRGYLEDTIEVADAEEENAALNAYRHRVGAAAEMTSSYASSNDSFRADWLGVVSKRTRQLIEERLEEARSYRFTEVRLRALESVSDTAKDSQLQEETKRLRERLQQLENRLPIHPTIIRKPEEKVPAVEASQSPVKCDARHNTGELVINLLRPVYNATGSGKFDPRMATVPRVEVELKDAPENVDHDKFQCYASAGTDFDFHIHMKSGQWGLMLPVGKYTFGYDAKVKEGDSLANK